MRTSSDAAIVFVHLGPELPPWLAPTMRQARQFNGCPIHLVAEACALRSFAPDAAVVEPVALEDLGVSDKHARFRRVSTLDRSFRDGFWTYTTERFFVLETAMRELRLRTAVHLESDVLIYIDIETHLTKLREVYPALAVPFDNDDRAVPSFVFVPQVESLARFTDFAIAAFSDGPSYGPAPNDMALFGAFRRRYREAVDHLPIVPSDYPGKLRSPAGHVAARPADYWNRFDELSVIFDAAALGQFLGGVDPRNCGGSTVGFVNESCVADPRILRPRLTSDVFGRVVPVVTTASGDHPVAALHIHSKNVSHFWSSAPCA